ncbi:MAG: hypothetical protein GX328_02635 [Clostridiaceae bacterium]|nr:hypothetical protein [Clostridiaceae bacterium]
MNNQNEKKEYNIAAVPATEVKQYTFGSENELEKSNQVKQNPRNRKRRSSNKRNQQNKNQTGKRTAGRQTAKTDSSDNTGKPVGKTTSGKQQVFQKQRKKNKSKRNLQSSVQVKLIETAADVKKDNQRIEKEIMLDIKEISRIEI